MKKILASLTAACMLLPMCALAACNGGKEPHAHTFAEAWSFDETCHWHAATCEHKNEVSEKSEHTMSGGKCSICGYRAPVVLTKDTDFAALVSDKVTEEEWNAAFSNEGFSGCSGRIERTDTNGDGESFKVNYDFGYDYIQNGDVIDVFGFFGSSRESSYYIHRAGNLLRTYYWGEGSDYEYTWLYAEGDVSSWTPEEIAEMKFEMSFACFVTFDFSSYYQKFTYDETKGAYVFEGTIDCKYSAPAASSFGFGVRISDAKAEIKFAGGKVAYVRVSGTGNSGYREETYCMFDYDEPKVNFPENAQPVPVPQG